MPCPGSASVGSPPAPRVFVNWARTFRHLGLNFTPTTLPELVAVVQRAEAAGANVKATGSGWSYTGAAVDTSVGMFIDTTALGRILSSANADPDRLETGMIPFALRDAFRNAPAQRRRFVHVEAGITIHALNSALDGMGLAMPTLGGANGQTLAGAVSTGTHGSDVELPPIPDFVRAIHLVGPGGQEWWLERGGALGLTDEGRMMQARDAGVLCGDIRILYDDDLFRAALVSLGRMGVIYSVVVEAVDAFNLVEERVADTWSAQAAWLRTSLRDGATYSGPRFLEIVVNPYRNPAGDRNCVVTRRDLTTAAPTPVAGGPDVFNLFCSLETVRPVLLALSLALPGMIALASATALAAISWMLLIPFVGPIVHAAASTAVVAGATAALVTLQVALVGLLTSPGENLGQKLAEICNLAARAGQPQVVPELIGAVLQAMRPAGPGRVAQSFRMLTGQGPAGSERPDDPACMRQIDGLEFCLDISRGRENLFDFMSDVFALVDEFLAARTPVGLALSLRFTRRTGARLGIQQFDRNCLVELILLRGLDGNAAFLDRVHAIAERRNAIPHWGLIHDLDGRKVAAHYGDNHRQWRLALERITGTGAGVRTFRTRFSIDRDLEPIPGCTVPRPLADLFWRVLLALARAGASRPRG